jgi:4'-phosphopantetheinyl transferase
VSRQAAQLQEALIDCYRLDLSACSEADLTLLDPAERARAARFRFARDRNRYVAAHAQVRRHLGARLGVAPEEVALAATPDGKPVLDADSMPPAAAARSSACCFNLTHSGSVGYLAIAPCSVGIDVELHRSMEDLQPLIDTYCSAAEIAALAGLPAGERTIGFLAVWTRKEAALKAWGTGIGAIPLDELHVGIDADALASRPAAAGDPYPALRLTSIAGPDQVLSIAAATAQPLRIRLVETPTGPAAP